MSGLVLRRSLLSFRAMGSTLAVAGLAACGGGGSGDGSPAAPVTIPPSGSSIPGEFNVTYGLTRVNGEAAYETGNLGAGVTVALVDTGGDVDHPDLRDNIHPASRNIRGGTLDDPTGHGTHIAGIVGAVADGKGTVGIAPSSQLLLVRADTDDPGICPAGGCFTDNDLATAINYAVDNSASVINLSLEKDAGQRINSAYRGALDRAAREDVLLVVAAGNGGNGKLSLPAAFAADASIDGHMIAVGAVNSSNTMWSGSNRPDNMSLAQRFLVAPGVSVRSTKPDDSYGSLTGTSVAAPYVSGAAAVLKGAFPSLSMEQVADILLESAQDLGAAGTDLVFGRGLLDLEAALQPSGAASLPLGSDIAGASVGLATTRLSLGAAFGDALEDATALRSGMFLDAYERPYRIDYSQMIAGPAAPPDLERLMVDDETSSTIVLGEGGDLPFTGSLTVAEARRAPLPGTVAASLQQEDGADRLDNLVLRTRLGAGTELSLTHGGDVAGLAGGSAIGKPGAGLFLDSTRLTTPQAGLLPDSTGLGLHHAIGESLVLGLGIAAGDGEHDGRSARAGLDWRGERLGLHAGVSVTTEDGRLLGSEGEGGFALADDSLDRFFEIGTSWRATDRLDLFAQATFGVSELAGGQGLIGEWSTVRSDAFALGAVAHDLAMPGDRFGVLLAQPLRVGDASAVIDVPVSRDLDGNVQRQRETVDATPSGREIDLQLAYERPLGDATSLGSWAMLRHEPGHDADAPMEFSLGLRLNHRF